jgi:hypothetical protein
MVLASGAGVTRGLGRVQERAARAAHASLSCMLALAFPVALGGCSAPGSLNPVDWWHELEGGAIAAARPPPPNADAPYPSLATVPPKPPPPDTASLRQVQSALVASRRDAQYAATVDPLPDMPAAPVRPAAAPPAAPAGEGQPNAALQAASAPPTTPPRPPPQTAPVVQSTAALSAPPAVAPEIPPAPPPPPRLPGVTIPQVTPPTTPPTAPPSPPAPSPPPGPPVAIGFFRGTAILPAEETVRLKTLARKRGGRTIAVTGFGEAASADPAVQAAALSLALDRARAVAAELMRDGVPAGAIRLLALAPGGGAMARLID